MARLPQLLYTMLALPTVASAQAASTIVDSAATAPPRRNTSWLTDTRRFKVGDIIKVAIDEYAIAEASKTTSAEASRDRQMGMGGSVSTGPGATALGPIDGGMEFADRGASRSRGEARRGSRYVAEIPVRVAVVTPEGLLQVSGSKVIDIDRNKQEMTVSGLVSPQDIDIGDVVRSSAIANANIVYTSKGLDKPRSGLLGRLVGIFWP